jgi:hypothetical protein
LSKRIKNSGRKSKGFGKSKRGTKTSTDRCIFRYFDGTRKRSIDPLDVQHTLTTRDNFDLDIDLKAAAGTSKYAADALHRVIDAVRAAFHVPPYDAGPPETGLTGAECMTLLVNFSLFIEDLKKKLGISPTSSPSEAPRDAPSNDGSKSDSSPTEPESLPPNP